MGSSARAGAWRAPATRAAVAAALAAVAATVLVGLGHADEGPEPGASQTPAALPVVAPSDGSVPTTAVPTTTARPTPAASSTTSAPPPTTERDDEDGTPGRIRMAAPRPGAQESDDAADTAPPSTTPPPTVQPAAATPPASAGEATPPPLVPGTPCTVTARACVALDDRQAWLIDTGAVVRGPVPIQHGDEADPTPRGTFQVEWKAEQYTSREYLTQMPYSVFFAPGGIAFHQGGQDTPSAGCVKLRPEDAKAWFAFLKVGDEVQIH